MIPYPLIILLVAVKSSSKYAASTFLSISNAIKVSQEAKLKRNHVLKLISVSDLI